CDARDHSLAAGDGHIRPVHNGALNLPALREKSACRQGRENQPDGCPLENRFHVNCPHRHSARVARGSKYRSTAVDSSAQRPLAESTKSVRYWLTEVFMGRLLLILLAAGSSSFLSAQNWSAWKPDPVYRGIQVREHCAG